jgi:hypothetical protein
MRRRAALGLALATAAIALGRQAWPAADAESNDYADGESIYAALRGTPAKRLEIGGGRLDVALVGDLAGFDQTPVMAWIRRSAVAVTTYFGRFPVERAGLLIVAEPGGRIHTGTTFGYDGSAIRVHVGRAAGEAAFREDWILVHEMTHLALPRLPERNLWLQEGNATYVEPIARAQAGQLDVATVWRWAIRGLPLGQGDPRTGQGAGGLDGTHDHGRIYWGGAAYWLLADIAIRQRTDGRMGVQAALRAINRASGGNGVLWTADRLVAAGDSATGGKELTRLYLEMKDAAYPVDTARLLGELGVAAVGDKVVFDEAAPLATIRRQITEPPL